MIGHIRFRSTASQLTPSAPYEMPTPPVGDRVLFCNNHENDSLWVMDEAGVVVEATIEDLAMVIDGLVKQVKDNNDRY